MRYSLARLQNRGQFAAMACGVALVAATLAVAQRTQQPIGDPASAATRTEQDRAGFSGKVISVQGETITLQGRDRARQEHTVPMNAAITLDGDEARLQDLRPGDRVRLTTRRDAADTALRIDARREMAERRDAPRQARRTAQTQETQTRAWLGVMLQQSDEPGATILRVYPSGPAARAGIRSGDSVVRINDTRVETPDSIVDVLQASEPGDVLEVTVVRNGVERSHTITAGAMEFAEPVAAADDEDFDETMIPEYAMHLEHQRRLSEHNQRIERLIFDLFEEIRELRQEVAALRNGEPAAREEAATEATVEDDLPIVEDPPVVEPREAAPPQPRDEVDETQEETVPPRPGAAPNP